MDDSLQQQCLEFGKKLGLDGPVSEEVLRTALQNEKYAYDLVVAAENYDPRILQFRLDHPPQPDSDKAPAVHHSNLELAARAAKALIRWSATGFARVDDETLERRRQACLACPHLRDPEYWTQNLITVKPRQDLPWDVAGKVCNLCGCVLSKKIHLPSETCPGEDPASPGRSRWGEAHRKKDSHH